jgi:hypothetical protein
VGKEARDVVTAIHGQDPGVAARKLEALIDSRQGLKPEERALLVAIGRRLREMEVRELPAAGAFQHFLPPPTDLSKALKPFEGE